MNKLFKSSEEVVSMFLGLVIVLVVVGLVYNFFQKRRGSISLPGVTDVTQLKLAEKTKEIVSENKVEENVYVVKPGDNLWKISNIMLGDGEKWTELAKLNKLNNPRLLAVGQKLVLPENKVDSTLATVGKGDEVVKNSTYTVVYGDSLWKISLKIYGDGFKWSEVWNRNKDKIIDPNRLEIGMMIKLE